MDLWIRSQDKTHFIKVNDIYTYGRRIMANYDSTIQDGTYLGSYKTKERAIEILDYISTTIAKDKNLSDDYNEADIQVKCSIANSMIKVYQMPKE